MIFSSLRGLAHVYGNNDDVRGSRRQKIQGDAHQSNSLDRRSHIRDRSVPTLHTWDRSVPTLHTWDRSVPTLHTWDRSVPTLHTWDRSVPTLHTWDRSS